MEQRPVSSPSEYIEVLNQMSVSVRAGLSQDPIAFAEAQERAFGLLMSMEANLGRAQRDGDNPARARELMDSIAALRGALNELRSVSGEAGQSRIGYGFVLPGQAPGDAGSMSLS
jgi:hypothetical protein